MGDEEDEKELEKELEIELEEQKDALHSLTQALSTDPNNPELLSVHEELVQSIKDAEEGFLHLKRTRLLLEVDASLLSLKKEPTDVKVEPVDPTETEAEPLADEEYSVGTKCRFRYNDGRWYNGLVVGLEGSRYAKISFCTPTSENMVMCKFFQQQRCRFGSNCRLSHGIDIPISSLKKYIPMKWDPSLAGSTIWALPDSKSGLWKEAELESWDEQLNLGHVVFRDDGSSAMLGAGNIELSEHAEASDEEEESYSGSEEFDSSDYEDDSPEGIGFVESTALQCGVQTDTTLFAKWENHTRGIASRMMANMGYREGMGLGASGQGMVDPIPVKVLPPKQSLDHAVKNQKSENQDNKKGKKRSRGGKRKREKKFAAAARAAKEKEESRPDVFTLINNHLAAHGETTNNSAVKGQKGKTKEKKEDRRALVAYDDEMKELKTRVQKLEEMMLRNRNEKPVYEAAMRKLNETREALANAEAAHASASNTVLSKENEKRWLKF